MIARFNKLRRTVSLLLATAWLCAGMMPAVVWATDPPPVQVAQAAAAPAPASAAKTPPPVPITDADLKAIAGPKPDDLAKGDPGGTLTGTVNDIVVSDSKKGLTLADLVNMVGQNRIAINFVWTLVTGFLVMFMQAGFAAVETGLCRAKNANHTMMMNFMVYGFGLFAYWVMGFAIQQGGCAPIANLGGLSPLNSRVRGQLSSAASPGDFSDSEDSS